jgi:hypothetical protein
MFSPFDGYSEACKGTKAMEDGQRQAARLLQYTGCSDLCILYSVSHSFLSSQLRPSLDDNVPVGPWHPTLNGSKQYLTSHHVQIRDIKEEEKEEIGGNAAARWRFKVKMVLSRVP